MRLLPGMDGFFYLSFPGKQVYWMVSENGRFESMKQKKEREKEISQWPWISMLPFGILAGYWGKREVRITAISEYGFQARLATPATAEQKNAPWELAFYDQKTAAYQRILLRDAIFLKEKEEDFDVVYTFATEQDDYRNAVQRLALQYGQYIRWKMEDDDAALAEEMTGLSCGAGRVSSGKPGRAEKGMVFRYREGNIYGIAKWLCGIRAARTAGRAGARTGPARMV